MRAVLILAPLAVAGALAANPAHADSHVTPYLAVDLLSPCQEADNDARWGEAAETECEQYILGFIGALGVTGGLGSEAGICPPEQNTADEARWAFMRWVHASYSTRKALPAAEALLDSLSDAFPCN